MTRTRRGRVRVPPAVLALPAVAVLAVAFVAPFVLLGLYSFYTSDLFGFVRELTLDNYAALRDDALFWELIVNSLVIGTAVGVACVVIGTPLAYIIRYRAGRLEYPLLLLLILSMFTSYLARIFSWQAMLSASGPVNRALDWLGVGPQQLLFTRGAVIVALVHIFVPYVTVTVYAAMRNLPKAVLELAADLGAGPVRVWSRILIPLLAAATAAPFLYTFVLAASDFATPQVLGGTGGNMVGSYIQQTFSDQGDWPLGAAMSLVVLLVFLGVYAVTRVGLRWLRLDRIPAVT
jgi:spermidine/putrescine transport system permease protein